MTNQEIKKQVMDLLNQIVILTKEVAEPLSREDYYPTQADVDDNGWEDSEGNPLKVDDDQTYLYTVGQYCQRVVSGGVEDANFNEKQYYNSTC